MTPKCKTCGSTDPQHDQEWCRIYWNSTLVTMDRDELRLIKGDPENEQESQENHNL